MSTPRPAWKRLDPEQQAEVAAYAAEHGLTAASCRFNVSITAVRRACAVTGIPPKPYERAASKTARIRSALSLLRSLGLTPADLLSPTP